jgi:hypothetical protein
MKRSSEFVKIFLKGLNPSKIQTKFNLVLLPEFLIQILLGILTSYQNQHCSFQICLRPHQIWKFLGIMKVRL